jgi:hypothetical protein
VPVPATVADAVSDGETVELTAPPSEGPSSDKLAALLLDDESPRSGSTLGPGDIPEGSTVMELPTPTKPGAAPAARKPVVGSGNTSDAAAEILKRYQRRPRSS